MSMDLNDTTDMLEGRTIFREITTTVNNSPSTSFLEKFKTLHLNETPEDVRSGNESLNLLDTPGQKVPKLKLNDLTINSTFNDSENTLSNPLDNSGVQPPRLNGTISIENTSNLNQHLNSSHQLPQDFDTTIDVQINPFENLSETLDEQTLQLNDTNELFVSTCEDINGLLDPSTAQHIDNLISSLDVTTEKPVNFNLTSVVDEPAKTEDPVNVSTEKLANFNLTSVVDEPPKTEDPVNVLTEKPANFNLTSVVDEPAKTEDPVNVSTEKAYEISQATEPAEPLKELNLTADLEKSQSSNTAFEVLNNTFNPSDISQPKLAQINETIVHDNTETTEVNSTFAVEEQSEELNKTAEKVEAENKPASPCEVSASEPTVEEQDLNDTVTFPQETEDSESCVASEEFVTPTDEIFQDPKDFDFLLSKSKSNCSQEKRLESLYVKFDPLYESRMLPQSNTIVENEDQNEMRTDDVSLPKHREATIEEENPDSTLITTGNKRRSVAAIDHLVTMLSYENESKETEQNQNLVEDMVKELKNLKEHVLELETELDKERAERIELETKLKGMNSVVDEYEKSMKNIISQAESERALLQEELRVSNQHLSNSEAAFNDVHEKYERIKGAVQILQANENTYKEAIEENLKTIEAIESRYQILRSHASEQLEKANVGLATCKKQHEVELLRERAKVARAELQCKCLADTIEQKTKENRELKKILDEIIAREDNN